MKPPKEGEPGWQHEGNYDPFYTRVGHDGDLFEYLHTAYELTREQGTKQRLLALAIEHSGVLHGDNPNFTETWTTWKQDAVRCFGRRWAEARDILPELPRPRPRGGLER
jgi:hypothetical protein